MSLDMFPDSAVEYIVNTEVCSECGKKIKVQIFKNSGVCSELCRKDRDNDHGPARSTA